MTTPTSVEIHGTVAPGFEPVRDAFRANFEAGAEVGASFAATVDGKYVVDIWGGYADAACTRPWQQNTIANVFSTTKAVVALAAAMLADRGQLDYNRRVADYWPEFGRNGKQAITVAHLLSHQSGLAGITEPVEHFYDWDTLIHALEDETPWWEPGTANGYHALTYGYLVGEVIRRISGQSVGTFIRNEIAGPIGADFLLGFGPEEDARIAEMVPPEEAFADLAPDSMLVRVMSNPPFDNGAANTREWRAAEIPAANGHGNARSCARILSALACGGEVDGVRLLSQAAIDRAITEQCYRDDLVLTIPMRWGLGFMLASPHMPLGPNPRTFGHGGAGGSLAIADLDARVSWAYVMNKMAATTVGDTRVGSIAQAFYTALAGGA
jgi:CubicO group peptidase (beta-lactamase class C family)